MKKPAPKKKSSSTARKANSAMLTVKQMPAAVLEIRELYHRRRDFMNASGNLSRQIKAIERRILAEPGVYPPKLRKPTTALSQQIEINTMPLVLAREPLEKEKKHWEKQLVDLTKRFPVYHTFVEPINGFGAIGLGQIIGEAGDLSKYSNPGKLWKRMGLAVFDGKSQRKSTNKELAVKMGYCPRRRSIMHVIGDSLIKKTNTYRDVYLERKKTELAKAKSEGLKVIAAASIPKSKADKYRSQGVIHLRALRYTEKRLLKHLWQAWRGEKPCDNWIKLKPARRRTSAVAEQQLAA